MRHTFLNTSSRSVACVPVAVWVFAWAIGMCFGTARAQSRGASDDLAVVAGTTAEQGTPVEDVGTPVAAVTPRPGRVAELGHAILATRAKARRDTLTQIQPVLDALSALREALRLYALELGTHAEQAVADPGTNVPTAPGDSAPDSQGGSPTLVAERRDARRQAAQDALQVLSDQRHVLATAQAVSAAQAQLMSSGQAQLGHGDQAGGSVADSVHVPDIHPEVIETLEADADAILASAPTTDDETQVAQLQKFLQRLEISEPRAPRTDEQPTFVFRQSVPLPIDAGAQ